MANFFPLVANNSANISNGFLGNRIEELQANSNLDFTSSGIVNLAVGNLGITGGNSGQVLATYGNGVQYWANGGTGGGGGNIIPQVQFTPLANGAGQTFTNANLSAFLDGSYATVYVNGVLLPAAQYTIASNTLTVSSYLSTADNVVVGPTGGAVGSGTVTNVATLTAPLNNTTASTLGFSLTGGPITTTGTVTLNVPSVTEFRTNANIGNVANANFSSNVNSFLNGLGGWTTPLLYAAGNVTEVQYANASGQLAGSANLTFNGTNLSTVNVFERYEDLGGNTVVNLANAAYFRKEITTTPVTLTVTGVPTGAQVGSFILHVANGASKSVTFGFGNSTPYIRWAGGVTPTLTSNNSVTSDILGFYTLNAGITWYGYVLGLGV